LRRGGKESFVPHAKETNNGRNLRKEECDMATVEEVYEATK
jgi:hypothetical protein